MVIGPLYLLIFTVYIIAYFCIFINGKNIPFIKDRPIFTEGVYIKASEVPPPMNYRDWNRMSNWEKDQYITKIVAFGLLMAIIILMAYSIGFTNGNAPCGHRVASTSPAMG